MEKNVFLTTVRGEPKTFGGRVEQSTPLPGCTETLVKLLAEPLSPVQLSVIVTVWAVAGIVTLAEPFAWLKFPLQPDTATLLVRVQFKLPPNPDAFHVIVVAVLMFTEVGLALILTDGPAPAVLIAGTPVSGSMATAASVELVVN